MKHFWALITLAVAQLVTGRGLKAPRAPDADSVRSKQLELENEELRQKNEKLEAMMQVARAEVRRMDMSAAEEKAVVRQRQGGGDKTEVLKQEIEDLKKKMKSMETDNLDLVQTLRKMMLKNSTQIFQKQAEHAKAMKMELAMRCAEERHTLEAKIKERESQIQDAAGKCDDTKELAKNLQEDNANLQKKVQGMQAELDKSAQQNKDLLANKAYLLETMQSLVSENGKFKQQLAKESSLETTEAKELAVDKKALAKLNKKAANKVVQKQPEKAAKPLLGYHKPSKAEKALVKAMNEMDGVDTTTHTLADHEKDMFPNEEKKLKVGAHLSDWLGLEKNKPEQKVVVHTDAPEKKAAQDLDAEAEDLLNDAKAQLAAMDADS